MTDQRGAVVAGVGAHIDEHHAAVLDLQGRLLGTAAFATTADGYAGLRAPTLPAPPPTVGEQV
jgi:hypothetical protein